MPSRSPAWTRDEIILATDLYVSVGYRVPDDQEPEVIALSDLLNTLPIHPESARGEKFRNPNGIALKISNIRYRDPDHPGGSPAGGKLDGLLWDELAGDVNRLHRIAAAIRSGIHQPAASVPVDLELDDDFAVTEGRTLLRLHVARERDRSVVARKKKQALAQTGTLACEVCGFDFHAVYGALGEGFIECHHVEPLAALGAERTTRPADLALVCANCHRMLHRRGLRTPDELRTQFAQRLSASQAGHRASRFG